MTEEIEHTMSRLSAYLAADRRRSLAAGSSLADRFDGSALLADISGFTPLTEALVRSLGPRRGAEELTRLLNTVYTDLTARVHRFGGSIVCFIGDALIACFPDDDGLRALASGFQMQRVMKRFQATPAPHGGRMTLSVKAAISIGPMRRFVVGDPSIQRIDVLAGKTIDRLADAEHAANPGDVVASPEVVRRLGNRLAIDTWRGRIGVVAGLREGPPVIDLPGEAAPLGRTVEHLRPYLLDPVADRVSSGHGDFLSELRPVAVVFVKFAGLDYDDDDEVGERLDRYTAWVQSIVEGYGGHVLLLTTADKGSHLYAVFGALEAHEDDSQRAVAAAVALLETPDELDFIRDVQIGVSYGRARVGAYGGDTRRTYGALGDVVNLAARLMSASPVGEIRCSASIVERARHQWRFEELEAVQLKGMSERQPVYRPSGRLAAAGPSAAAALVGRDAELEELTAALDAVENGARRIRLIEGEAGIGKSRLVGELLCIAGERGFTCLFGAGDSIERRVPYRAWRDVLGGLFDLDAELSADEHRERVLAALEDRDASDRAPLLNDVLSLGLPETSTTAGLTPEVRQESLAALIGELITHRCSTRPMLLVLDDAHWMDSPSWGMTVSVARTLAQKPVLLVLTHRPFGDVQPGDLSALSRLSDAEVVCLQSLSAGATLDLAAAQLGLTADAMPSAIADVLAERSEGNPFYARELIGALLDAGQIAIEDGTCTIPGGADLRESIPGTLEGIVLARLDRLPDGEQTTMKVASVLGRSFLVRAVRDVYPSPVETGELHRHLDDTTHRRLTVLESGDPDRSYAFQHIITQQVTYDTLLFEQRRTLHQHVARWVESANAEDLAPHYPLLVFHWGRAGQPDVECRYCRLAAAEAARRFANTEADLYFARALELMDEMGEDAFSNRRFETIRDRVEVLAILGRVDEERAALDALLAIAGSADDRNRQGDVLVRWSDLHNRCGQFDDALDCGQEALRAMRDAGHVEGEAQALTQLGRTYEEQGDYAKAREYVERSLGIFGEIDALDGQAANRKSLGIIHARLGELPQAMERFEQAGRDYRALNDRKGEAEILGNLGALSYYLGDYEATIRYTRQAQPLFEEMGNRSGSARCLSNLGNSYSALGAFEDARHAHERSLDAYRQLEDANSCADGYTNLGNVHHAMGVRGYPELTLRVHPPNEQLRQALEAHQTALSMQQDIGSQAGEVLSHFNLGSVYLCLGDLAQANRHLQQARDAGEELGLETIVVRSLAALARADLQAGDVPSATERSAQAIERLGDDASIADEIRFTRYHALLAAGCNQEAGVLLKETHDSVMERAAGLSDESFRRSFEAMHHEIEAAWNAFAAASG